MVQKLLVLTTMLVLAVLAPTVPASADTRSSSDTGRPDNAPDFGSATAVVGDSDYEITDDGYLIYEGDTVVGCDAVRPENYTIAEVYEEQAGICAEAGFPPGGALPETGGPSALPVLAAMLLACGSLGGVVRARRDRS